MWNKMSLAMKLGTGFGIVVIIAIVLGLLAVVNMKGVEQTTDILVQEKVPEVSVANNIERWALKSMIEMRSYWFTEDETYWQSAFQDLQKMKDYIKAAKAQAASSPRLSALKEDVEITEIAASEFEVLANKGLELTHAQQKSRHRRHPGPKRDVPENIKMRRIKKIL
ncbi:MAG: hypothetical protein HQL13_04925 [Candidatus Omnitrophica bacterium]|nr:hypothetical protein [Candidatus Omnitrophota bacterium]